VREFEEVGVLVKYLEVKLIFKELLSKRYSFKANRDVSVDFYNRSKEIPFMKKVLESMPRFSIVTGLVHSGKSVLLSKVVENLHSSRPVIKKID